MNVEDDEAGRLAGFRARFGRGYDIGKETTETKTPPSDEIKGEPSSEKEVGWDDNDFGEEEDANILDLISSYGQAEDARTKSKGK